MARLTAVNPANATGRVKEIFEGPLKGKTFNIFTAMANSPAALDAYLGMSGALNKASLTPAEREAIALAVGEVNNCTYCVNAHTAIGKMSGLTEEQTLSARRGQFKDNPKMDALVRFALRLHEKKGFVSDKDVADFKGAGYTDAAIAEVCAVYALNYYTNIFNHVNDTVSDFPAAPKI